ncbi:MAG: hypothetical protein K8I30_17555, partial [Anaerolineae bacterium]|nr:hypothetical protein [Anaerolineae bacterium]
MSESTTLSFVIRDGLQDDIPLCVGLDHAYSTDFVWQMSILDEERHFQVSFKTERLPRTLETVVAPNTDRL